ncbi:MAG TPA: AraC family transcriptional regulator [Acetobacteraceae bacterium]|jgi:AraC family transcriptional regulator|nr:AraC family transcriptional regulator [Acetobacteraceae bacterium]
MHAQLTMSAPAIPIQGIMACQQGVDPRAAGKQAIAKSMRPQDLMAVEVDRLLEDVKMAFGRDLRTATQAAGRLAALLASKLPHQAAPGPVRGGLAPWQKCKVQNYIEDQLEGSILIKDLAKLVSLSSSHFCRAFKESFGETPHTYIVRARIERARILMLTTPDSLSQIAFSCGLADQAHFCRWFRQTMGMTPGAWRRSHAIGA